MQNLFSNKKLFSFFHVKKLIQSFFSEFIRQYENYWLFFILERGGNIIKRQKWGKNYVQTLFDEKFSVNF